MIPSDDGLLLFGCIERESSNQSLCEDKPKPNQPNASNCAVTHLHFKFRKKYKTSHFHYIEWFHAEGAVCHLKWEWKREQEKWWRHTHQAETQQHQQQAPVTAWKVKWKPIECKKRMQMLHQWLKRGRNTDWSRNNKTLNIKMKMLNSMMNNGAPPPPRTFSLGGFSFVVVAAVIVHLRFHLLCWCAVSFNSSTFFFSLWFIFLLNWFDNLIRESKEKFAI